MIKVALYGLDARAASSGSVALPVWFGVLVLALGALSALGWDRLRALPERPEAAAGAQLDRERRDHRARPRRRLMLARPRRRCLGWPSRSAPRCCTPSTTPSSSRCCFSARALSSGRPARSISTGSAACCGGCRGRPAPSWSARWRSPACRPLNGFASEWLTLQALLQIAANGEVGGRDRRRGSAGRPRRDRRARALLLRQGRRPRAARAGADASRRGSRGGLAAADARRRCCCSRARAWRSASRRASLFGALVGLAPWPAASADRSPVSSCRAPGRCRESGSLSSWLRSRARWRLYAGRRHARLRRRPGLRASSSRRALLWTGAGFTKPLRLVLETVLAPAAGDHGSQRRRRAAARSPTRGSSAAPARGARLRAADARRCSPRAAHARRLQSGSLGTYVALSRRPRPRAPRRRSLRVDRMSAETAVAAAVQLLRRDRARAAPAWARAALEGAPAGTARAERRCSRTASCGGCGARAAVTPEGTSVLYRLAPSVVGAAMIAAVLVVPVAAAAPSFGIGHDALLLLGLLALARFVVAIAAWDAGSGFSLRSAPAAT